MRIVPIISNSLFSIYKTENKKNITVQPIVNLQCDTVSFGRKAANAKQLRELMRYGMVDIWTGKPVINPEFFEKMLQNKLFSSSVKNILKTTHGLKDSLHDVPAQIYSMLEEYAKTNPNAKLEDIFKQWGVYAQTELKKIQMPIFEKLKTLSESLPEMEKALFDRLMATSMEQIDKKPILQPFCKKDFMYKLVRISQEIKQRNISDEVKAINRILKMANEIPDLGLDDVNKKSKVYKEKIKLQKSRFQKLQNYLERSSLSNENELKTLFYNAKCQLLEIPSFLPFGRKNFIRELREIINSVSDKSLKKRLIDTAVSLPTASKEVSAFIVKASRQTSEKIGYDIFHGSVGNIDHLEVHCRGGKDAIENYVVSSHYINSERSNKSVKEQFKSNPGAYLGCQKYFDRLFYLYTRGIINRVGLDLEYIIDLIKTMENMSPPNKRLKINCDITNF